MESTLNAAFKDLQADVGHFLGYGRGLAFGSTTWTRDQQDDIDRALKGGLRKFYNCGYDWSFLHPLATLTLKSGLNYVKLPGDFAGLEGPITVSVAAGTAVCRLTDGRLQDIIDREAVSPTSTGQPMLLAKQALKGTSLLRSSGTQFRVWPTADQDYSLACQYYILPDCLNGRRPYAYGGAQHAECLLEACLSVAETIKDNKLDIHDAKFKEMLAISQDLDRRMKPQNLGPNLDRSDERRRRRHDFVDRGNMVDTPVRFNGQTY